MFIKFCGFTREEDIATALELKVSAVGFIFHEESKRYITPGAAKKLSVMARGRAIRVGVFTHHSIRDVTEIAETADLDYLQVYPDAGIEELRRIRPLLISHRITGEESLRLCIDPGENNYLLIDSYHPELHGGTGKSFNWDILSNFPYLHKTIIAGGINIENVHRLLSGLSPFGIDLSSGIELSPGIKSEEKMRLLIKRIDEVHHDKTA